MSHQHCAADDRRGDARMLRIAPEFDRGHALTQGTQTCPSLSRQNRRGSRLSIAGLCRLVAGSARSQESLPPPLPRRFLWERGGPFRRHGVRALLACDREVVNQLRPQFDRGHALTQGTQTCPSLSRQNRRGSRLSIAGLSRLVAGSARSRDPRPSPSPTSLSVGEGWAVPTARGEGSPQCPITPTAGTAPRSGA